MKKAFGFVSLIVLMFMVVPAHAQLKFGVKGGVNISSIHLNSSVVDANNVTGFHVGPMIETAIPILGIGMEAALLYSQKGVEIDDESIKVDYIDIPIHLKWKFGLPIVKAYLASGPYFGFQVSGDKAWDIPGNVVEQIKTKTFGAGWDFGAGVEVFSHLQVGFNYGLGLTNNYTILRDGQKSSEGKNRGWAITAAILF